MINNSKNLMKEILKMKHNKFLVLVLLFAFSINLLLFAQNDQEYSGEEWQKLMDEATDKKNNLQIQLHLLFEEGDSLKQVIAEKESEFKRDLDLLYLSVGATKSDVGEYRKIFESAEKCINGKGGTREVQIQIFDEIRVSKIKCLPEFWERFKALKRRLATWDN
jgi:hypothetical protein